ncbi:MAG: GntR family transcriptional regulator [Stenotrophobium sp.]
MKIRRSCMRDPVRDAIVSRILDGSYAPGTRLKELELAREFNVSQAPVREALRELAALGLVATEHYRGTRVRALDLVELREAYVLRLVIEQAAARAAVPASAEDLHALSAELSPMSATAQAHVIDGYMESVLRFHRKIVEMSANRLFLEVWESMAWNVRARVMARRIGLLCTHTQTRERIAQALADGDGDHAARLLGEITANLLRRLDQAIASSRQEGHSSD